jgi:tRNA(Ile2) C34 agmatinyltransferase TiaS
MYAFICPRCERRLHSSARTTRCDHCADTLGDDARQRTTHPHRKPGAQPVAVGLTVADPTLFPAP